MKVEKQRQYLGGDSEHTILVKGLDVALMEQNKARAFVSGDDDDELEQVYQEMTAGSSAAPSVPVRKTKEDLLRELKLKRQRDSAEFETQAKESEAKLLEEAKKAGKFKPIGSQQAGGPSKGKKVKVKDGERKKKKVKVSAVKEGQKQGARGEAGVAVAEKEQHISKTDANASLSRGDPALMSTEPVDIFAGVDEYNIIEPDDNEDENVDDGDLPIPEDAARGKWCEVEERKVLPPPRSPPRIVQPSQNITEDAEHEQQARLIPLASSSLPSIRDFLAMDDALQAEEKKKKRKEKKKGGEAGGAQKQRNAELKAGL
jgi:IK cytokine